jgi:hypothetical protein
VNGALVVTDGAWCVSATSAVSRERSAASMELGNATVGPFDGEAVAAGAGSVTVTVVLRCR